MMAFAFDDFRVASRSTHAEHSATYAHNSVNQMTSLTVGGLLTWTMTYDAWGRIHGRTPTGTETS